MQQVGKWGNGRNWNKSPQTEGGWIRLCPIISNQRSEENISPKATNNVRKIVQQVVINLKIVLQCTKNTIVSGC